MLAIVDASVIFPAADTSDRDHIRCLNVLQRSDLELVVPALVIAGATYLIGRRLGPRAEVGFLRALGRFDIQAPDAQDWARIADLAEQYIDFPLGGTDASVVVLAERLGARVIATLDRRRFAAIRPLHCDAFELLPDF